MVETRSRVGVPVRPPELGQARTPRHRPFRAERVRQVLKHRPRELQRRHSLQKDPKPLLERRPVKGGAESYKTGIRPQMARQNLRPLSHHGGLRSVPAETHAGPSPRNKNKLDVTLGRGHDPDLSARSKDDAAPEPCTF